MDMINLITEFLSRRRNYIFIFVFFFLIESLLSLWTGLPYDMDVWFNTGMWMSQGINIYEPLHHLGYPPLWSFWSSVAYNVYSFFGENIELWRFIIKLPIILAHLGLAHLMGIFISNRYGQKNGLKTVAVILGWPFFIYIGALWGQINPISVLLTFLAFYFIIKQKVKTSALFLGIAITLKVYPLIILPAFLIYIFKKIDRKTAGKFLLLSISIPIVFTGLVFTIFQWDLLFFLKTIFYSTPMFETNPSQIISGCMNVWSFVALPAFGIEMHWIFRLFWIPILGIATIFWSKKNKFETLDFILAIVSLYLLFLISYGWVSEQLFLDPLPFIFMTILVYRPKKLHFYILVFIQILVFSFSLFNWGPFIFEPLVETFFPNFLSLIRVMDPSKNQFIWNLRGILGLIISISLGLYLFLLLKQPKIKLLEKS